MTDSDAATPKQAHEAQQAGAFLLDVRTPEEYNEAHAPGAVLVPLATLGQQMDKIPSDGPVYVMCRSGQRSGMACQQLRAAGRGNVTNVEGGIMAWEAAGLPVERQGRTTAGLWPFRKG